MTDTRQRVTRAPARTRLFNPITTTLMRLGLRVDPRMALLTIRGRKTGRDRTLPIGLFERDGRKYVVAAFGEVNWVVNLRAASEATITQGGRTARHTAEQVQGEEAALILRDCLAAYLPSPLAGPMLRQRIAVSAEAPLDVLAIEARRTPVFRLTPTSVVGAVRGRTSSTGTTFRAKDISPFSAPTPRRSCS
jgi:deazaflavin-dependent oxidoreductase (nitroreductase family)